MFRGCFGGVRGYQGNSRVSFVSELAQVELKRGRVYAPGWRCARSWQARRRTNTSSRYPCGTRASASRRARSRSSSTGSVRYGLTGIARQVIKPIPNPHFLGQMIFCDVASNILRSLKSGGQQHDAQLRRDGARAGHQQAARAHDGRGHGGLVGRGFHPSTFQLNLSRF